MTITVTNISNRLVLIGGTSISPGQVKPVDDSYATNVAYLQGQGLISYTGYPAYTGQWIGRPSASAAGKKAAIYITDVPANGLTQFYSDGAYWKYNGQLTLEAPGLPVILPSSGSMANNGAITLTTALPAVYAACYLYLPANAISTGSAAGLYYTQMSSTTVGTVFNNVYTTGHPSQPAAPTAFVTTGPGAYTQTTGAALALLTTTVPASLMALNGVVNVAPIFLYPNNGNNKILGVTFGAASAYAATRTTSTQDTPLLDIRNCGVANKNVSGWAVSGTPQTASTSGITEMTVDTTADVLLTHTARLATATDYVVLRGTEVTVVSF